MVGNRYTVIHSQTGETIVHNQLCRAIIGSGQILTDSQILDYFFKGDNKKMKCSPHLEELKRPHKVEKVVLETTVIPMTRWFKFMEE